MDDERNPGREEDAGADQGGDEGDAGIERAALRRWAAHEPPADFAERVLAARRAAVEPGGAEDARPRRPSRRLAVSATVVGVACVGALVIGLVRGDAPPAREGVARVDARTTVTLGGRGVAVAEAGSALSWRVAADGSARIEQRAGNVFYRVDARRGATFVVDTPAGQIDVTGTCFRVEVEPMKDKAKNKVLLAAGVSAAVTAAVVVTVYEGHVRVSDAAGESRPVAAGQKVSLATDDGPGAAPVVELGVDPDTVADLIAPPPAPDATREELLARDAVQREKLAALEAKLQIVQRDLLSARKATPRGDEDTDADGRPWFDPSPQSLREMARECRVRYDIPPVNGSTPLVLQPADADKFGLDADEVAAFNDVMAAMHAQWLTEVRTIYIEATGDVSGADKLSAAAMERELHDKSQPGEGARAQKQIAWERAGLAEPPADLSGASPIERYFRRLSQIGDEAERRLASRLGAERARELRESNGGWGQRMEYAGCPGDDGEVEVEQ